MTSCEYAYAPKYVAGVGAPPYAPPSAPYPGHPADDAPGIGAPMGPSSGAGMAEVDGSDGGFPAVEPPAGATAAMGGDGDAAGGDVAGGGGGAAAAALASESPAERDLEEDDDFLASFLEEPLLDLPSFFLLDDLPPDSGVAIARGARGRGEATHACGAG